MALGVAEKLGELLERVRYLIAIELLVSAQAVDLREIDRAVLGEGVRARPISACAGSFRCSTKTVRWARTSIASSAPSPRACLRPGRLTRAPAMKWLLRNWTDVAYALWEHITIS